MISQPDSSISPCPPLPSGTWRTPGLSIPWCCLPTSSSSVCLVFFPLSLCLARWFTRPDKWETWPYHCSLCLFTMVRSSCGLIACWILAWTFSLVAQSLYEMCSILRYHLISMAYILLWSSAPWFTSIQEEGCDKGAHQMHFETERNTSVIPNCQCCCCLCYPGEYLRLGTLISYNWAQVLKLVTVWSFCPFTFIF